jgi:predicted flap endonuclease-1-like 5' DNA nuclease
MRVLKVFFLGLVYGWFLRWILDVIFHEDELRILSNENALLRQRIRAVESPGSLATRSVKQTARALLPVEDVQPAAAGETAQRVARSDDLKMIKGVGPQIEKKLNDAGVHSFDQMSRLTTSELQSILGLSKRVVQNADNLLTQAKKFAQQGPKG